MTEQEEFDTYKPAITPPISSGNVVRSLRCVPIPGGWFALALATENGTEGPYIIKGVAAASLRETLRMSGNT